MYEDVIKLVKTNMETCLEGEIMQAVMRVGVEVNKDELIRALAYDRGQYEKGYRDGVESVQRHAHWIDSKDAIRCSECLNTPLYDYHGRLKLSKACPTCGAKMWKEE